MTISELEALVTDAGLILISKWAPRFLVSLRVPTTYGTRCQAGKIEFVSQHAFETATRDEVTVAINEIKARLERAAKTIQGDVAKGGTVFVGTQCAVASSGVQYPAH